jgi:hypothetical protein
MTEADAKNLIQRYATSYFVEDSSEGWFQASKSGRSITSRAIGGSKVPILKGRELTAAMIENVEDSRLAVRDCGERLARARVDGLLDKDAFNGLPRKTKALWLAAVQTVKGDYQRAVGEMTQWQEYAELASEGKLPTLTRPGGIGELVQELADAKSDPTQERYP